MSDLINVGGVDFYKGSLASSKVLPDGRVEAILKDGSIMTYAEQKQQHKPSVSIEEEDTAFSCPGLSIDDLTSAEIKTPKEQPTKVKLVHCEDVKLTTGDKADDITITGWEGEDDSSKNVIVDAGEGDNEVKVKCGRDIKVIAGNGDNKLTEACPRGDANKNISFIAGNGNNKIITNFRTPSIQVGDGNNTISPKGDVAIKAGKGTTTLVAGAKIDENDGWEQQFGKPGEPMTGNVTVDTKKGGKVNVVPPETGYIESLKINTTKVDVSKDVKISDPNIFKK